MTSIWKKTNILGIAESSFTFTIIKLNCSCCFSDVGCYKVFYKVMNQNVGSTVPCRQIELLLCYNNRSHTDVELQPDFILRV